MTRARALKTAIRARIARTGERYTTARRHVLNARAAPAPAPLPAPGSEARPPRTVPAVDVAGAVSDARCLERTGHGLAHWFEVLDRFGAEGQGHTAAARHLHDAHGVDSWYSQGITVAYERARGLRVRNQRTGGAFAFTASRMVPAGAADTVRAIAEKRRRAKWTAGIDAAIVAALSSAFDASGASGFVAKAGGQARCRCRWDGGVLEILVVPKTATKSSVIVEQAKLPAKAMVDERRARWRSALRTLAAHLAGE